MVVENLFLLMSVIKMTFL